ncbi:PAS domain S-box protein, partial [candidate division KSB1 bacterium]|nr:PAS domain S-box protein [candidate division KSB1 bacterium]
MIEFINQFLHLMMLIMPGMIILLIFFITYRRKSGKRIRQLVMVLCVILTVCNVVIYANRWLDHDMISRLFPSVLIGFMFALAQMKKQKPPRQLPTHDIDDFYHDIIANAPVAIFIVQDEKIKICNPAMAQLFGYESPKKMRNMSVFNLVATPYRAEVQSRMKHLFQEDSSKEQYCIQGNRRDGTIVFTEVTLWPIHFNGKPAIHGWAVNITERLDAEKALANERDFLQALMDNIPDLIFFKDSASKYTRVNKALATALGLQSIEQATGKSDFDFYSEQDAQNSVEDDIFIYENGVPLIGKVNRQRTEKGKMQWISTTKVPIKNRKGAITGIVGISRDISILKETEDALRYAKKSAEEANRAKSDFLANISHEIRTPMNGILGMTELALSTSLSPQQRDFLSTIKTSADSLLIVLNDIIDFSEIEAGEMMIESISFNLHHVVEDAISALASQAHKKSLECLYTIHPDVPVQVKGDPLRLKQVMLNILGNAVKFTETGEIILQVSVIPESSRSKKSVNEVFSSVIVNFKITDTGIGMNPEKLDTIFDSFSQIDGSRSRKYGGTGLGLAICKNLVQQMGGQIWAESEFGRGSCIHFNVTLQIDEQEDMHPLFSEANDANSRLILVIDDNKTHCEFMHRLLTSWGFLPTTVFTAQQALRTIQLSKKVGTVFPVILIDDHMPGIAFRELIENLRSIIGYEQSNFIQMVSLAEETAIPIAGITQKILKPVRQSELFNLLYDILRVHDMPADNVLAQSWHILLAED